MINSFLQRKNSILSKIDKSSIGSWDKKIVKLCEKINSLDDCYTTSSCSGRIMIIVDQDKKAPGLFQFVSHDFVKLNELMDKIPKKGDFKFKQEPMILHIACEDIEAAKKILRKTKEVGLKRSGIISLGKNIIIEVVGTEKIEFPLVEEGKLLVDSSFLEKVLAQSSENLKKSWLKIEKLRKSL